MSDTKSITNAWNEMLRHASVFETTPEKYETPQDGQEAIQATQRFGSHFVAYIEGKRCPSTSEFPPSGPYSQDDLRIAAFIKAQGLASVFEEGIRQTLGPKKDDYPDGLAEQLLSASFLVVPFCPIRQPLCGQLVPKL